MRYDLLMDSVLAILASTGLMTLLWLFFGLLIFRQKKGSPAVHTVIPACGSAGWLEQAVRLAQWKHSLLFLRGQIIILDLGMDAEAVKTARVLARDDARIAISAPGMLAASIGKANCYINTDTYIPEGKDVTKQHGNIGNN